MNTFATPMTMFKDGSNEHLCHSLADMFMTLAMNMCTTHTPHCELHYSYATTISTAALIQNFTNTTVKMMQDQLAKPLSGSM